MSPSFDQLAKQLIPHYKDFNVSKRLLFTGHSHQAWPDVAREGLNECYASAARDVDQKWSLAFDKADVLRDYLRYWYDDPDGYYCLAENTHILLVSWLSSLDLKNKPKIITTTGEFHSMYRQLRRLGEEGLEVVMLDPAPADTFVERLSAEIDNKTAAIMLSRVFFETGLINPNLSRVAQLARAAEIPVMIDDYHGTNVVPLSLRDADLDDCFLVTGGYKYLQWGEGNCFLRFPKHCELRPAITGWYASFDTLELPRDNQPIHYDQGDQRFATATYDPASQFRAARVVEFFKSQGLTKTVLRDQYLAQLSYFKRQFDAVDLDPAMIRPVHNEPLTHNGGFLSFYCQNTGEIHAALKERGVLTDYRGDKLRFGVAPYITAAQIDEAVENLAQCIQR
jgi:selenocysteine lyase/cysteine desulfurase